MATKTTLAGGLHSLSDTEISETENRAQGSQTQPSYERRMIHTKAKWKQLVQMKGQKFRDPSTSRWSSRSSDRAIIPRVLCRYNQTRSNFRRCNIYQLTTMPKIKLHHLAPSSSVWYEVVEHENFFYLGVMRKHVQSRRPKINIQFWRMEYHLEGDQSVEIWNGSRTCL